MNYNQSCLVNYLPGLQHMMSIEDHYQLPHLSQERICGPPWDFTRSRFQVMQDSPGIETVSLTTQHWCHPAPLAILQYVLHDGEYTHPRLTVAPATYDFPRVSGTNRRIFWVDHRHPESKRHGNVLLSHASAQRPIRDTGEMIVNIEEAEVVLNLVRYLTTMGALVYVDIAVITPYNGQLMVLMNKLHRLKRSDLWL